MEEKSLKYSSGNFYQRGGTRVDSKEAHEKVPQRSSIVETDREYESTTLDSKVWRVNHLVSSLDFVPIASKVRSFLRQVPNSSSRVEIYHPDS